MKKLISLGLALVMCLALMIPALATEETFDTENSALVPTIEVEMPASAGVVLNPYGMTYSDGILGSGGSSTSQIISNLFYVTNKTKGAKLKVETKVTGVAAGNAVLEEDSTKVTGTPAKFAATETANKVLLNLKYNFTATAGAAPTAIGDAAKTLVVKSSEQDLHSTAIVLPPATDSANSYLYFQFTGVAVEAPETMWSDSDTVGATFVFTFTATTDAVTTAFTA